MSGNAGTSSQPGRAPGADLPVASEECGCVPSCCGGGAVTNRGSAARSPERPVPGAGARYTVRPAERRDLGGVRALLDEAGLPTDGVEEQFAGRYAVAESEGWVIAAEGMEVHGNYGLLRSAVVDEAWRGRGIGEALTRDRLAWARERGLAAVYLLTSTAESYWPKFGFEVVDRSSAPAPIQASREFASICPSSATTMRLALASAAGADAESLRAVVREKYGAAARQAAAGSSASCGCGPSCCGGSESATWNPITSDLYDAGETRGIPAEALLASLGCGNPTALAQLAPGEVVLDLGSGGGIDVLLSAKRVGPTGRAYGLDMTDEMLELARANQRRAGVDNVEFLKGEIENVPLPDNSVDVIISNCVINLSADKRRVLAEAFRVLRPGGRFAVSDIVIRGEVPPLVRRSLELWVGCVAGALEETEFRRLLAEVGFVDVEIEPTRVYRLEDARELLEGLSADVGALATELDGRVMSAFVRGRKPARGA